MLEQGRTGLTKNTGYYRDFSVITDPTSLLILGGILGIRYGGATTAPKPLTIKKSQKASPNTPANKGRAPAALAPMENRLW